MKNSILLIEDDHKLAEMIKDFLHHSGFTVTVADKGQDGLKCIKNQYFNLIILDLMLPDMDGLDICKSLRLDISTPIIMLTAKGDPLDRVIGLELGADDYIPKPFEPRELLARIKAILRRGGQSQAKDKHNRFGRLEIDTDSMKAFIDGKPCELTSYQFQLLTVMSRNQGRVLTRDFLMNALQGNDIDSFDRSIDVHISRIRSEIEDDPKHPRRIITVRGSGYVFARAQEEI
ncbi:MAG: response regulator transcription factor [Pseudomonadota bacterium]